MCTRSIHKIGTHQEWLSERTSQQAFFDTSGLLFAASAALTIAWCGSMSTMAKMPMPGGWAMSMTWMRMPGQTWIEATASFLAMWIVMMAATMLPSLVPMLAHFRKAVGWAGESRLGRLTALAGLGYFFVWTLFGVAVFPLGVALSTVEMDIPALARAIPFAVGAVIFLAGAIQFTSWKAHHLASCRKAPRHGRRSSADASSAWRQEVRFGFHCSLSCANLTAILLVMGVMDLRAMAALTATITLERLPPAGKLVARTIGSVIIGAGLLLIVNAVRLG